MIFIALFKCKWLSELTWGNWKFYLLLKLSFSAKEQQPVKFQFRVPTASCIIHGKHREINEVLRTVTELKLVGFFPFQQPSMKPWLLVIVTFGGHLERNGALRLHFSPRSQTVHKVGHWVLLWDKSFLSVNFSFLELEGQWNFNVKFEWLRVGDTETHSKNQDIRKVGFSTTS